MRDWGTGMVEMCADTDEIPIFVISLKQSPERFRRVQEELARFGLRPRLVRGIDGRRKSSLLKLLTRELYPVSRDTTYRMRILGKDSWELFDLRRHLVDHRREGRRLTEQRRDVVEEDPRLREVGYLADLGAQVVDGEGRGHGGGTLRACVGQ